MKKVTVFIATLFFGIVTLSAQSTEFGATAGYNSLIATATFNGASGSDSVSGFYVGLFADFETSDKFHVQPEIQYVNSIQNGESGGSLVIPVLGRYYISEEVSLNFGPQLDFILEESPGVKALGLAIAVGLSYDINTNIFLSFKYALGLTDRLEDGAVIFDEFGNSISSEGITTKFSFLQIGLGFKF
ncbi:outer membrane beta-barrel protein [uncultured Algibacter sp.]|uniref:outer membrane beta-barrel protein n=1 Tax=uncultured Algibacter sp. TaxID=298659 RepID=UPI00262C39CF|nr:outer membrane beta-barrel protein [uncultured Algibacter sp.]